MDVHIRNYDEIVIIVDWFLLRGDASGVRQQFVGLEYVLPSSDSKLDGIRSAVHFNWNFRKCFEVI